MTQIEKQEYKNWTGKSFNEAAALTSKITGYSVKRPIAWPVVITGVIALFTIACLFVATMLPLV